MKFLPSGYNTKDLEKKSKGSNNWRWPWLNEVDSEGDLWGVWLRKPEIPGYAFCECCQKTLKYDGGGKKDLKKHAEELVHKRNKRTIKSNEINVNPASANTDFPNMAFSLTSDMDMLKNLPAYKPLLRTVLKSQIQLLVEQLSEYGDEECIFLTASLTDGTLSHIGSKHGHSFLTRHKNIKANFLKFCLEKNSDSSPTHQSTNAHLSGSQEQRKLDQRQNPIKQPEPKRLKLDSIETIGSPDELAEIITVDAEIDSVNICTWLSEGCEIDKEKMEHLHNINLVIDKSSHEINGCEMSLSGCKGSDEIKTCDNTGDAAKVDSCNVKVEPDWGADCEDGITNMKEKQTTESTASLILTCTEIPSLCQKSSAAFLQPEFLCQNDSLIWEKNSQPKQKRVIKSATLLKKYSAIKEVEQTKKSKSLIAKEFGVPKSTLSTWMKHSEQIKADVEKAKIDPRKKKRRFSNFYDIENALLEWLKIVHLQGVIPKITSVNICDKANQLAQQFGYTSETFQCSKGWVERFKVRHGFDKNFVKGDNCNGE